MLVYYDLMIRLKPLPEILSSIRNMKPVTNISEQEAMIRLDKLWRACGFWLTRFFRSPRPCLRRSLVLYHWCMKHGIESKLFVGAGKDGAKLKGHAWLSIYGKIYREDPLQLEKDYVVMLES